MKDQSGQLKKKKKKRKITLKNGMNLTKYQSEQSQHLHQQK